MKLKYTIVDEHMRAIGFMLEGTPEEFGEFGKGEIVRPIMMRELMSKGFKNSQIEAKHNRITERSGFKLNELPILKYNSAGAGLEQFTQVDNKIRLVKRILVNGTMAGFDIIIGGTPQRYRYDDVIRLCNWFKPENFVLRTLANGTIFIAGKPGVMKLAELPEEEIGNFVDTGVKKRTRTGGQKAELVKGDTVRNSSSLLQLYDVINSCNGIIIKLPDESYTATSEAKDKIASEFTPLNIGEVGNPHIEFGESKLNANTLFKKIGIVSVNLGVPIPYYTFTWSTKSIFSNGENHIKRFGIGVTPDGAQQIINIFGTQLMTKKITDKHIVEPIEGVTGKRGLTYFEVDTSKLDIMTTEEAPKCIMNTKNLYKTVTKLSRLKLTNKVLKGCLKKLNASGVGGKELFAAFAGMTPDQLKAIEEAGIDLHSGAFTKREAIDKSEAKDSKASKVPDTVIQIEYDIAGSSAAKDVTYDNIVTAIKTDGTLPKLCDVELATLVKNIMGMSNENEQFKYVDRLSKEADKSINELRKKLWLHKVAMFTLGGKTKLHIPNAACWVEKPSRSKKAKLYECTAPSCDGLVMKLTDIEFK